MLRNVRRLLVVLVVLALGGAAPLGAEVFCKAGTTNVDQRVVMPATKSLPWGAVGYLNNGCTATLISREYILAAGHCFTQVWDTAWQQKLYFFPNFTRGEGRTLVRNFHPVDRAVVGARADISERDWGIGHLATPVTDYPALALANAPAATPFNVVSGGYGRDLLRTKARGRPAGAPCEGACANNGNVWWDNALVDPACTVRSTKGDTVITDCAVVGGNSGSPIVRPNAGPGGAPVVVGVVHGGGRNDPDRARNEVACVDRAGANANNLGGGPAVQRFRYAPLRATSVAVTSPAGKAHATVFTSDVGAYRIVGRTRTKPSPTAPFEYYSFRSFLPAPTHLASFVQPGGAPALVAIAAKGRLFVQPSEGGDWGVWRELDRPAGVDALADVDTVENGAELFALAADGRVFRRRLENGGWSAWLPVQGTDRRRIAVVQAANGRRYVASVRADGRISLQRQTGSAWAAAFTNAVPLSATTFNRFVDVDALRDAEGILHVYGADGAGGVFERRTPGKSTSEWLDWEHLNVHQFVTDDAYKKKATAKAVTYGYWREVTGPRLDRLSSIVAARWPENGAIVVFALDDFGNAYSTERRCVQGSCFWAGWQPFTD